MTYELTPFCICHLLRYLLRFTAMKRHESPRKGSSGGYLKVFDSRKRRVRGMWERGGKNFANMTLTDELGNKLSRWMPPKGARSTKPVCITESCSSNARTNNFCRSAYPPSLKLFTHQPTCHSWKLPVNAKPPSKKKYATSNAGCRPWDRCALTKSVPIISPK